MTKLLIVLVSVIIAFHPISVKAESPMTIEDYAEACEMTIEEFELMSSVVEAESNRSTDGDIEGRVYIALVIFNRADDGRFGGDSISEVLNARGQFSTVRNGHSVTNRTEFSDAAVLEAYEWNESGDDPEVLYFNCRNYFTGHEAYCESGGNYFSLD